MEVLLGIVDIVLLVLLFGLGAAFYSVRHAMSHHSHPDQHLAPMRHEHHLIPEHTHPDYAVAQHEHPFVKHAHEPHHEHRPGEYEHVHFWVRHDDPYVGPRGRQVANYHCDIPNCGAKCQHEFE